MMIKNLIISVVLALVSGPVVAFGLFGENDTQEPPQVQPFKLPTLTGEEADFRGYMNPLIEAPKLDADAIFAQATNCYPESSRFRLEVHLEAGARTQGIITADNKTIGKNYAGIVAKMPLYSPTSSSREREREYMRRTATSEQIGRLVTAIAIRNHSHRAVALYTALEARSQVRVQKGLTETAEQVGYMEKLLSAHEAFLKAEAEITAARLAISGQCSENRRDGLNNWLKQMAILQEAES